MDGYHKFCEINTALVIMDRFYYCQMTVPWEKWMTTIFIFMPETRGIMDLMSATGMVNWLNTFEKRDDCKCLFQRNTISFKKLDHCKQPPGIMIVPLKYMTASAPLK